MSELAGFAGDKGLDVNETLPFTGKTTASGTQTTCGCLIKIEKSEQNSSFVCPEWVTIKWVAAITKKNRMKQSGADS